MDYPFEGAFINLTDYDRHIKRHIAIRLAGERSITTNYWLKNIYPEEIAAAHRNADFHIHDLAGGKELRLMFPAILEKLFSREETLPEPYPAISIPKKTLRPLRRWQIIRHGISDPSVEETAWTLPGTILRNLPRML